MESSNLVYKLKRFVVKVIEVVSIIAVVVGG